MSDAEALRRRWERERAARRQAEAIVEEKTRALYVANQALEKSVEERTAELRSALGHLEVVLANLGDGLLAADRSGQASIVNPALRRMLGLRPEAGPAIEELLPEALHAHVHAVLAGGGDVAIELDLPGGRAGKATVSAIRPVHDDRRRTEETIGALVLVRDVTIEREVDRMKTDFISTVSHELRTPLTSVLGFARLTRNKLEEDVFPHVPGDQKRAAKAVARVRENLGIIVSEGTRLTALINDVLDVAKMESGRVEWRSEPVAIGDVVERAVASATALFEGRPVKLVTAVAPDLPAVTSDPDRLLQVVLNLLSNAAKFTDQGEVTVRARVAEGELRVEVSDTGVGIDPADHALVFERFKQVGDTLTDKPKGTGLGLPICKQIVEHHQGRIGVDSALGAGSTFWFTLPLGDEGARPVVAPAVERLVSRLREEVAAAARPETRSILVVDDDANLRELLHQTLEAQGYRVRTAANGYAAMAEVKRERPDLVLLDVLMPDLTGFEVAAMLRNDPLTSTLPIIVLSIVEDRERGFRLGIDRFLSKPIDPEVLLREIGTLLARGRSPKRVLVVDDDAATLTSLTELLTTRGFQIVGTCSGPEAVAAALDTRPDLVLVDALSSRDGEIVRALRFERELEHVLVVMLVGEQHRDARGAE